MTDCHIHLEQGSYTLDWVREFIRVAQEQGVEEIHLLEHSYRFREFAPMYDRVRAYSGYIRDWFQRRGSLFDLGEYLALVELARGMDSPVTVKFGLEVCYFPGEEELVRRITQGAGLDFLVGSVHFVDGFAYDHIPELWVGENVDRVYRRYFELSVELAQSGLFCGIAHPDCVKLFGHRPSFPLGGCYDSLAAALAQGGMYAEESSGIHRRTGAPLGMAPELLRAMRRHGVEICTASDAHRPQDVGANFPQLLELLRSPD